MSEVAESVCRFVGDALDRERESERSLSALEIKTTNDGMKFGGKAMRCDAPDRSRKKMGGCILVERCFTRKSLLKKSRRQVSTFVFLCRSRTKIDFCWRTSRSLVDERTAWYLPPKVSFLSVLCHIIGFFFSFTSSFLRFASRFG